MLFRSIDTYYFNDSVVRFFEAEDIDDLARAMLEMVTDSALRESILRNADRFIEDFQWSKNKHIYYDLVDSLIRRPE